MFLSVSENARGRRTGGTVRPAKAVFFVWEPSCPPIYNYSRPDLSRGESMRGFCRARSQMIHGRNPRKRQTRWMNCTLKSVVPCNSVGPGFDWVKEAAARDGRTLLRFSRDLPGKDV